MAVLDLFGWNHAFAAVVGNDSSGNHKPHPEPALVALAQLGCLPEHAAFVGDAEVDMLCGRSAGIGALVALIGTTGPTELIAAGATHCCRDLSAFLDVLMPGELTSDLASQPV